MVPATPVTKAGVLRSNAVVDAQMRSPNSLHMFCHITLRFSIRVLSSSEVISGNELVMRFTRAFKFCFLIVFP